MEQSERRYNLRSLPGGRRGAPGAGAGCSSLRTTGDETLNRRALVTQDATAGRRELSKRAHDVEATAESIGDDTISLFSSIPSTRPSYMTRRTSTVSSSSTLDGVVRDVITDYELAPTSGLNRTRRRWTPEMNIFILRTYLQLTTLHTDTKNYLEPLHLKFIEMFPNMNVSRQRVGDQRRAIVRNKLLPQETINQIYDDVRKELSHPHHIHQNRESVRNIQKDTSESHNPQTQIRMKWTNEQNESLIRSYYRITQLETNKTAYRKSLHEAFIRDFPTCAQLSEQRVADQRRAIIHNKYISDNRLNEIKQQIAQELSTNLNNLNNGTNKANTVNEPNTANTDNENLNNIEFNLLEQDPLASQQIERDPIIDETFRKAFQYFKDIEPTSRNHIPKQKPSKKLAKIVHYLNEVTLSENNNAETDFITLQTTIYCAAWTAAKVNGTKLILEPVERSRQMKTHKPSWQRRLEKRLEDLRTKIGRLIQFINGNTNRKLEKQIKNIVEQYKTHSAHEESNMHLTHTLDTLKQKLAVVSGRLRRNIIQATTNIQENRNSDNKGNLPDMKNLRDFWAGIWENPVEHNMQADWIQSETANNNSSIQEMTFEYIPMTTFKKVLSNLHNWKSAGSDCIHSYWYKKFTKTHEHLLKHINQFIENPNTIPDYITRGISFMILKDFKDPANPAKYRPITCLQTLYKIMTSCISELIYEHIAENKCLAEQQKGCRKFSQGCKEQLIIDSVVLKQALKSKSNLFSMYIDYKKAYDSVPHSWLRKVLEIYKIHPKIITLLKTAMKNWTTQLKIPTSSTTIETQPIKIQRGIFQGDALSPLWFCLALNPLSNILNSTQLGFHIQDKSINGHPEPNETINHLLYMDDIKLYASSENDLIQLATLTEQFTKDIKMEFGIDKCRINSIKCGQYFQHHYTMTTGEQIEPLEEQETYKYLGYNQARQIQYKEIKQQLKQQFRHRLNTILKTQLNARNIIKAINSFAIPILTYSFGIITWTKSDLKALQRIIHTTMTKTHKHHPRSCLQRLTLPRKEGGRGLIDIVNLHNKQITTLRQYFFNKAESSPIHKAIINSDHKLTPLNLKNKTTQNNEKIIEEKTKIAEWTGKSLHGRHRQDLCQTNVDKEASNAWLSRGELFPETEGFIMAIQDQVIETKNYQKYITKTLTSDICRKCNSCPETIQHITGACKAIVQTDFKHRHDQVANIIHQKLAYQNNFITSIQPYYKYKPESVLENSTAKLYFDRAILTDRTIHYNRPDITLINKTNKTAYLIDIAVPNTHNIQNTIAEKISKYTELQYEITRLWNLQKVTIVPIVLSTTGVIPKQLHHAINTLKLPPNIYHQLQKAVILNTCRIVRKFLQIGLDVPGTSTG
ncbi:uncharacterized protein LOC128200179 [Galleria mellonella]|uniref:Uncharacterized protein LOC128200179 n=1 Tax=Galleria mellonella TaxID=7137 RepID=A0ABM3MB56_GALME|nr:uncharacterized protein LOC128200179 [Galleria mellonella]